MRGVDGVDLDGLWAWPCEAGGPALFGRRWTEAEREGGLLVLLSWLVRLCESETGEGEVVDLPRGGLAGRGLSFVLCALT